MKKIDNWLSIQRFVSEASQITVPTGTTNVEVWGRAKSSRSLRKTRRFIVPRITNI